MLMFVLLTFALDTNKVDCSVDVPPPINVTFVIVGFRHGFRNPIRWIQNDTSRQTYGWGWEGAGQLTNFGKRQAYGLGKFLRQRYDNLLPEQFVPDQIKAYSSSSDRCQMTMLSALAGLYAPKKKTKFEPDLNWQPIPYETNDPLLRVFESKCPTYSKIHQPFLEDRVLEARQWLQSKAELVKYITKHTGFNGSLIDLSHAADNIIAMMQTNVPLPGWIENSTLPNYPRDVLLREVLRFAASNPILCAKDAACAKPLAGMWLGDLVDLLTRKMDGRLTERRMNLYATHIEGVLPLLRLFGTNLNDTPPSSGFLLEFRPTPGPAAVRLIYHEADEERPEIRRARPLTLPLKPHPETPAWWYGAKDFVDGIRANALNDWNKYCGLPKCSN